MSTQGKKLVEIVSLEKSYQLGAIDTPVLRKVSVTFDQGSFSAIVGPSGSGKTSLLRVVAGLIVPREARVALDGDCWIDTSLSIARPTRDRPIGYVGSAVMLNAKLKPKMTLLHVIAMTRALGEARTQQNEQPEVFRWTDGGGSYVDATFAQGKLVQWALTRPPVPEEDAPAQETPPA